MTKYEAFDDKTELIQYLKQPDCAKYRFKLLVMGDSDYIQKQFSAHSNNQSSLHVNFSGKTKEIQWKEYFSFNFLVQVNTQMRPYIYFNNDMSKMLVQASTDFSALIYQRSEVQ